MVPELVRQVVKNLVAFHISSQSLRLRRRRQTPQGLSLQLGAAGVDAVAFASGSAARTFARHWVGPVPAVAVLGPTTAQEAAEAGLPVHAQAAHPTLEALAEAVVRLSPSGPG